MSGCATQAQRQFQAIKANNQVAGAQYLSCVSAVYDAPDATPVQSKTPLKADDITLPQLADPSTATASETQAIFGLHPKLKECQRAVLAELGKSTPSFVPILVKEYGRFDDALLLLIQRKISWGDFNKRRRDNASVAQAAIQEAGRQLTSELREMHQNEMAQRQAAAEAIAQWAQTQQMINAMNRPVITNCNRMGSMVNCVSQ